MQCKSMTLAPCEQIAQLTVQKPLCLFVLIPESEALDPFRKTFRNTFLLKQSNQTLSKQLADEQVVTFWKFPNHACVYSVLSLELRYHVSADFVNRQIKYLKAV